MPTARGKENRALAKVTAMASQSIEGGRREGFPTNAAKTMLRSHCEVASGDDQRELDRSEGSPGLKAPDYCTHSAETEGVRSEAGRRG